MAKSSNPASPIVSADATWAWMERHANRLLIAGALVSANAVLVIMSAHVRGPEIATTILEVVLALAAFGLLHRAVRRMVGQAVRSARHEGAVARQLTQAVEALGTSAAGVRGTVEALCTSAQSSGLEVFMWDAEERTLWSPQWQTRVVLTAATSRRLEHAMAARQPLRIADGSVAGALPAEIACRGGSSALFVAPMWEGDQMFGIVLRRFASIREMTRSAAGATLVASFAALGSVALGKAQVVDLEQQRARDNELLVSSVHAAGETRERSRIADHAMQAAHALNSERAAIFALEGGQLHLVGSYGVDARRERSAPGIRMRSDLVNLALHAGGDPFIVTLDDIDPVNLELLGDLEFADDVVVLALRDHAGLVGLVVVQCPVAGTRLAPGMATLVSVLGRQASLSIERSRMLRSIRKRSRHLACTPKLARSLTGQRDPQAVARITARELHEGFGFDRVTIALRDDADGTLHIVASAGERACSSRRVETTDILEEAYVSGRPYVSVTGDLSDERVTGAAYQDMDSPDGCQGRIVVPIASRDHRVTGVIAVYERDSDNLTEDDLHMLETVADQLAGTLEQAELFETLERTYFKTVEALSAALEAKDAYTLDHARSITDLSAEVGRRMGMRGDEVRDLKLGALLHDIGKIGVPNEILSKPGPLTDDEFEIMKEHTIIGEQIIAPIEFLEGVRPLVLHEHERWDGCGYPHELRGDMIPLGARIIFVCDSWHAMTSDRPYRKALPNEEALRRIREASGSQFDPQVVEAFCEVLAQNPDMCNVAIHQTA